MKVKMQLSIDLDDWEVEKYMQRNPRIDTMEEAIQLEFMMHLSNSEELILNDVIISECEIVNE